MRGAAQKPLGKSEEEEEEEEAEGESLMWQPPLNHLTCENSAPIRSSEFYNVKEITRRQCELGKYIRNVVFLQTIYFLL